ncbi:LAFA_0D10572g1_1 [Lachancea sp. 'fantastica']|nr:LAFA_0D10572g1_1 [Lachancea sp. 'fantastica']
MNSPSFNNAGVVKKRRAKVSTACDNCRKRKIKCTGDQPCLNCQTYNCECNFTRGVPVTPASTGAPKRPKPSARTATSFSESSSDFASLSSKSSVSSHANSISFSKGDPQNGLYGDDTHVTRQMYLLSSTLRSLREAQPSPLIMEAIRSVSEQLREIETSWKPTLEPEAIRDVPATATSLETQLMINKYSDKVSLTKYSTIQPSPFLSRSSVINQYPVVDDLYGLYSPGLIMSIRGIGFLFKHFFDPGVKMAREYKTTLFLMLKFFDTCADYLDLSFQSWSSPIDTHAALAHVTYDSREFAIRKFVATIPSYIVEKTKALYPQFPCPTDVKDNLGMLHWITRVMFVCCQGSLCDDHEVEECLVLDEEGEEFLSAQESLCVLGFEYFNATAYMPSGNLDYLDTLLLFIKYQYWMGEYHVIPQLSLRLASYAQNMGLHRWEYYVGMEEVTAERRRRLWWECYSKDVICSVLNGKQGLITHANVSCLLPEYCRNLGILEFEELLQKIAFVETLPSGSAKDKLGFCSTALAIVVADFFQNVLYSKKNTCFRNNAKPSRLREKILSDLIEDVDRFTQRVGRIEKLAKMICDLADQHVQGESSQEDLFLEKVVAPRIVVFLEFSKSICLGSAEHLFARFKENGFPRTIQEPLKSYRLTIHTSWRSVIASIDNEKVESVWLALSCGCMLSLAVLTDLFAQDTPDTMQDVRLILRSAKSLARLAFLDQVTGELADTCRMLRTFTKAKTLFQILTRTGLQLFMRASHISITEFLDLLAAEDAELVSTASQLLMLPQETFKACSFTNKKTTWRLNVERSLEQAQALVGQEQLPDSDSPHPLMDSWSHLGLPNATNPAEAAKAKEAVPPMSPLINFNLGSLDDFLNYGEDDLYNKLWSDINIGIPDLTSNQDL